MAPSSLSRYILTRDMSVFNSFAWVAFCSKLVNERFIRLNKPFVIADSTCIGRKSINYSLF